MGELTDTQIDQALQRGKAASASEPRADTARYDAITRRVVVELTNGATFAFPTDLAEGLEGATDDELSAVAILGSGYGLHWVALDVDLALPGLLAGIFGTAAHMARLAGQATSPTKAAAARINGAKGGRPRKAVA